MGGWPTAVADRLCAGCDLLEVPCCRGLSFPRRRDWAAFAALLVVSSRNLSGCDELPPAVAEGCARVDEVLGGGMGPPPMGVAVLFMAGEFWVDGGRGWARGVVSVELCDTAGEW